MPDRLLDPFGIPVWKNYRTIQLYEAYIVSVIYTLNYLQLRVQS